MLSSSCPKIIHEKVEDIRRFMNENNIDKNLEDKAQILSLGIYKIDKNNNKRWIIYMKGPKNSLYKDGVFKLTIDFPDNFPNKKPEVRFINKIYHLQVNPSNGHVCAGFLNNWKIDTTISEVFVGIYMFLILDQNPDSPYSGEMAREYRNNRPEFEKKVVEYIKKYSSPNSEDVILINQMERENSTDKKLVDLENKIQMLEGQILNMQNEINQMKYIVLEKDSKIDFYRDKYIKLLEEIKEKNK